MSFQIQWTSEAKITFNLNLEYLAKDWTPATINSFLDRVDEVIAAIEANPRLFPSYDTNKRIHRCVVNKHLILYYKIVNENRVDLITFWNTHQNPDRLDIG